MDNTVLEAHSEQDEYRQQNEAVFLSELDSDQSGCLLEVSNFITQYHPHLLRGENVGTVTPNHLEEVLQYRSLLKVARRIKDFRAVVSSNRVWTEHSLPVDEKLMTSKLKKLEKQLKLVPERTKIIDIILRRFEVWSTKLVAQDLLVASHEQFDSNATASDSVGKKLKKGPPGSCCHSCLLSLPCSKHFSSLFSRVDIKDGLNECSSTSTSCYDQATVDCCTLALPPNRYTFKAYAKFARAVSLYLEGNVSQDQLHIQSEETQHRQLLKSLLQSPACEHNLNKLRKHHHGTNPIYSEDYQWRPVDLLALWTRSQRNTQSMRHYQSLFEVQRSPSTNSYSSANDCFSAVLRGNPPYVESHVQETSDYVDQLVAWAVINQTLYTDPTVKKQLLEQRLGRATQKRPRAISEPASSLFARKRIRWDQNSDGSNLSITKERQLVMLRVACMRHLLRTFARRHRKALFPLFHDNLDSIVDLDIGNKVNMKIWEDVQCLRQNEGFSELRKCWKEIVSRNGSTNKLNIELDTFASLDRYLENGELPPSALKCRILQMLDALDKTAVDKAWPDWPQLIKAANHDFVQLSDHFSDHFSQASDSIDNNNEDNIYQLASSLMVIGGRTGTQLTSLLNQTPAPWGNLCISCRQTPSEGSVRCCINCERVYHNRCARDGKHVRFADVVHTHPQLLRIFKLKVPSNITRPVFLPPSSSALRIVEWQEQDITIRRELLESGRVYPLQLSIRQTEDCDATFDALNSSSASLFSIRSDEEKKIRGHSVCLAGKFEYKGCLVIHVNENGAGFRSGLRVGDIITSIEFTDFVCGEDEEKYGREAHDLSLLSESKRMSLLRVQTTSCRLKVMRPSIDVVQIGIDWYLAVKKANKKYLSQICQHIDSTFWICPSCDKKPKVLNTESQRILCEADFCRTTVRRVAMESHAKPFLEESGEVKDYFSLRRLDAMFTSIMQRNPNEMTLVYGCDAFFKPSRHSETQSTKQRIEWADEPLEKRPLQLLFNAIGVLLDRPVSGVNDESIQQFAMLRHLLITVTFWCVGGTSNNVSFTTTGPPDWYRAGEAPWLRRTCSVCFSRECEDSTSTCIDTSCRRVAASNTAGNKEISDLATESILEEMLLYIERASVVGTTFLVLPCDSLVQGVSRVVSIEHDNRPVEFVVASYLPGTFLHVVASGRNLDEYDDVDEDDGIYHLLPVVSAQQQKYLLDRCAVRCTKEGNLLSSDVKVLDLEGVARYSPSALRRKLNESLALRFAIDQTMFRHLCNNSLPAYSFPGTGSEACEEITVEIEDFRWHKSVLDAFFIGRTSSQVIRNLATRDPVNAMQVANDEIDRQTEKSLALIKPSSGTIRMNPCKDNCFHVLDISGDAGCRLYYSDLLYKNEQEKSALQNMLEPQSLSRFNANYKLKAARTYQFHPQARIGWGFEIVKWEKDNNLLRVGRVIKGSAASKSGLKTHDVIAALNGFRVSTFSAYSEFICTVRGVPNVTAPPGSPNPHYLNSILSTIQNLDDQYFKTVSLAVCRPYFDLLPPSTNSASYSNRSSGSLDRSASLTSAIAISSGLPLPHAHSGQNNVSTFRASKVPNSQTNDQMRNQNGDPLLHGNANSPSDQSLRNSSMLYLPQLLNGTIKSRRSMSENDFYRPAGWGTVLTVLEVAIFFQAVSNNSWKYGLRLLMPRYDLSTLTQQISIIMKTWTPHQIVTIPVLNTDCYRAILDLDERRMVCKQLPEVGDYILKENVNGQVYLYRNPRKVLPIDRSIERWYQDYLRSNVANHGGVTSYHHPTAYHIPHSSYHGHHLLDNPSASQQFNLSSIVSNPRVSHPARSEQPAPLALDSSGNYIHDRTQSPYNYSVSYRSNAQNQLPGAYGEISCPTGINVSSGVGTCDEKDPPFENHSINQLDEEIIDLLDSDEENATAERRGLVDSGSQGPESLADAAERIRGGGDDATNDNGNGTHDEYNTRLMDVSPSQWNGKPVFASVETENNGLVIEAMLVGFVNFDIAQHCGSLPESVNVDSYYLSNVGYFEKSKVHEFYVDELYLVGDDARKEEVKVLSKLRSLGLDPGASQKRIIAPSFPKPSSDDGGLSQNLKSTVILDEGQSSTETQGGVEPSSLDQPMIEEQDVLDACAEGSPPDECNENGLGSAKDMWKKLATKHVRRLDQMYCIGTLPDGRDALWFSNDPRGLFIQETTSLESENEGPGRHLQRIAERQYNSSHICSNSAASSRLNCTWGCTVLSSSVRVCLGFPCQEELDLHYAQFHSFGPPSKVVSIGRARFQRIDSGSAIVNLSIGITSAIVGCYPSLEEMTDKLGSSLRSTKSSTFYMSPSDQSLNFPVNKVTTCAIHKVYSESESRYLRSLCVLWSRLSLLFDCHKTGLFRLMEDEYLVPLSSSGFFLQSNKKPETAQTCECVDSKSDGISVGFSGVVDCALCSLLFERYIPTNQRSSDVTFNEELKLNRSVGCDLLSYAASSGAPCPLKTRDELGSHAQTYLGKAKMVLVEVAKSIPGSVKLTQVDATSTGSIDPLNGFRVFDSKEQYEAWVSLVYGINNTRMLSQALVALIASIDRSKLPSWWARKTSGWSTSQFLATETDLSSLFLHIYVLDAAITEVTSSLRNKTPSQTQRQRNRRINSGNLNQRQILENYWESAMAQGNVPFLGDHDNKCFACFEVTGELLPCNLCGNSQHRKCSFTLGRRDNSKLDRFLCDSCLEDIEDYENEIENDRDESSQEEIVHVGTLMQELGL